MLLKPVEFVRELFPAYNPEVVVKVPPSRTKEYKFELQNILHEKKKNTHTTKSVARQINAVTEMRKHIVKRGKKDFCETTI